MAQALKEQIRHLEEKLLRYEVRQNVAELSELISEDFIEFGNSGRGYSKRDVLEELPHAAAVDMKIDDFRVRALTQDVALSNYRTISRDEQTGRETRSLRSSIWQLTEGRWQIVFHQGTPAEKRI
jgi:hypothetical protein